MIPPNNTAPIGTTMPYIHGFAPVARSDATRLILGTIPGNRSLEQEQYYAHPQNAFWRIMGTHLQCDPASSYALRCQSLQDAHIALWDVIAGCSRCSSLDSDIMATSITVNDFGLFLEQHASIKVIYFNGAKAESLFRRYVHPLHPAPREIILRRLPSTSPANARYSYAQKLEAWAIVL